MRISDWSSDVCSSDLDDLLVYGEPAICPFRSADTRLFGICGDEGVERLRFSEPGSPCLDIVGRSATRLGFADPAIIAVIAHCQGNIAATRHKSLVVKHTSILVPSGVKAALLTTLCPR